MNTRRVSPSTRRKCAAEHARPLQPLRDQAQHQAHGARQGGGRRHLPQAGSPLIGEDSLTLGADVRGAGSPRRGRWPRSFSTPPRPLGGYTVTVGGSMPALVGLMNERGGRDTRGSLANILAAAETTGPERLECSRRRISKQIGGTSLSRSDP